MRFPPAPQSRFFHSSPSLARIAQSGFGDGGAVNAPAGVSGKASKPLPRRPPPRPTRAGMNDLGKAAALLTNGVLGPKQRRFPAAGARQRGARDPAAREGEALGAQEEAGRAAGPPAAALGPHVSLPTPPAGRRDWVRGQDMLIRGEIAAVTRSPRTRAASRTKMVFSRGLQHDERTRPYC